jgi:hypothetical protein
MLTRYSESQTGFRFIVGRVYRLMGELRGLLLSRRLLPLRRSVETFSGTRYL